MGGITGILERIEDIFNPKRKTLREIEERMKAEKSYFEAFNSRLLLNPSEETLAFPVISRQDVSMISIDEAVQIAQDYHRQNPDKHTIISAVIGYEVREDQRKNKV
jgi:hypothetical protein